MIEANRHEPDCDVELLVPRTSQDAIGNRFTERYKVDHRYVAAWHKWMVYRDGLWREDSTLAVFDRVRVICREAAQEVLLGKNKEGESKQLTAASTIAAVERIASWDQRTAATVDQWDGNSWLMNTSGGRVELADGTLRPHRMEDYFTKMTGVSPPDVADCSLWLKFLDRITAGNKELELYLQRLAGYCLTGSTREEALFFLYGTGANGKGTFSNTLLGIWGMYGQVAAIETFTEQKNDRHPTELAALRGARLVIASETESASRLAESRIKMLTGGDPIRARFMRCDEFEYKPQFKIVIQGNHKPSLRNVDEAIRRRFHLVPFTVTIPPEERDKDLKEKLKAEYPGILRWAIDGCLEWQKQGLNPPQVVLDATDEYLTTEDSIGCWLEERAIVSPQARNTKAAVLYADFKQWAEAANEQTRSKKRFTQALRDKGFTVRRSTGTVVDGIELREEV